MDDQVGTVVLGPPNAPQDVALRAIAGIHDVRMREIDEAPAPAGGGGNPGVVGADILCAIERHIRRRRHEQIATHGGRVVVFDVDPARIFARGRRRVVHLPGVQVRGRDEVGCGEGCAVFRTRSQFDRPARHRHQRIAHHHVGQRHSADVAHREHVANRLPGGRVCLWKRRLDQFDPGKPDVRAHDRDGIRCGFTQLIGSAHGDEIVAHGQRDGDLPVGAGRKASRPAQAVAPGDLPDHLGVGDATQGVVAYAVRHRVRHIGNGQIRTGAGQDPQIRPLGRIGRI